jgi:hypothetical protein
MAIIKLTKDQVVDMLGMSNVKTILGLMERKAESSAKTDWDKPIVKRSTNIASVGISLEKPGKPMLYVHAQTKLKNKGAVNTRCTIDIKLAKPKVEFEDFVGIG